MAVIKWQYGQEGPGGGSVPGWIMATGQIAPYAARDVRRDVSVRSITDMTNIPVARRPDVVGTNTPAPLSGAVLGADASGRPMRHFNMPGAPTSPLAQQAVGALKRVAGILRRQGLENLGPAMVGGPLAALARGEAVRLQWPNGVTISAAL